MPGAQHLPLSDTAPTDGGPAKAIAHVTWDKNGTAKAPKALVPFEDLRSYFSTGGAGMAPHILWDPFTGRFAQFYPANSRSKSVADQPGGTRTNRAGSVVIQIEALFFPYCVVGSRTYARLTDTPCKGWPALNAWVRSWGVPNAWPMGHPVNYDSNRSERVWEHQAGWYGHSQVPENDHQDPGSWPAFTPPPASPKPPFPGAKYFHAGAVNGYVTQLGKQLVAKHFGRHYTVGPGPSWGEADRLNVQDFQHAQGWTGGDADGYPGPETWRRLFA